MVVITVRLNSNGERVLFENPLHPAGGSFRFIRLVSCVLQNSWHNLKVSSTVLDQGNSYSAGLNAGHYSLALLQNKFNGLHSSLKIYPQSEFGEISIVNGSSHDFTFSSGFSELFGQTSVSGNKILNVPCLNWPKLYFIHCDLVDQESNFLDSKESDLLAFFMVKGVGFEKVHYDTPVNEPFRSCVNSDLINGVSFRVFDEKGSLFDFRTGCPLVFEIELL